MMDDFLMSNGSTLDTHGRSNLTDREVFTFGQSCECVSDYSFLFCPRERQIYFIFGVIHFFFFFALHVHIIANITTITIRTKSIGVCLISETHGTLS